MLARQKVICIQ